MSKLNALTALLLRSPLLWGCALSFGFFALIHMGFVTHPLVIRYLAGHWCEYVEVAMFFVGLAALLIKAAELRRQRAEVRDDRLEPIPEGGQDPAAAVELAATLAEDHAGAAVGGSYLDRRLGEALDLVVRTGTADSLEEHLKYLSDLDAARAAQSYGLVRFVIWAIPIMGFLGTVIGITDAIACLSPTQLDNMSGVVGGLGVAFDTTAIALGLSMVLMLVQFGVDRYEQSLLAEVDAVVWASLAGRFQSLAGGDGGAALAMARLGETMSRGSARLLEAQEQSWRSLERTAATNLATVLEETGRTLNASLAASLDGTLSRWSDSLVTAHEAALSHREDRWTRTAESLAEAVRGLERHHGSLADQTALLGKVVEATRDIASLERSLDANLNTLAATGRFDETLATLAAAVQLLAVRAGDVSGDQRRVELQPVRRTGKAA